MLTARVHLDACGVENGPVQVLPGAHGHGRRSADAIAALRASGSPVACASARGGALVMLPTILHASSPATRPAHRRVVHLAFAADELPHGLAWHGRW